MYLSIRQAAKTIGLSIKMGGGRKNNSWLSYTRMT